MVGGMGPENDPHRRDPRDAQEYALMLSYGNSYTSET